MTNYANGWLAFRIVPPTSNTDNAGSIAVAVPIVDLGTDKRFFRLSGNRRAQWVGSNRTLTVTNNNNQSQTADRFDYITLVSGGAQSGSGGGTSVVANPTEDGTVQLTKVEIAGVVYNIPSGTTLTQAQLDAIANVANKADQSSLDTLEGTVNTNTENIANKQDKLNGTVGQVVGFDTNGDAIAQTPPAVVADYMIM